MYCNNMTNDELIRYADGLESIDPATAKVLLNRLIETSDRLELYIAVFGGRGSGGMRLLVDAYDA